MLESTFKRNFKEKVLLLFSDLDIDFIEPKSRSMPDLFIIAPFAWAAIEFKRSDLSPHRPNQDYHINRLHRKGFAMFCFPENEEEVLNELEKLFSP